MDDLNYNYLNQHGIKGDAEILSAKETGTWENNQPEVKFTLLVNILGKTPYQANYTEVVNLVDLGSMQKGAH